MLPFARLHENDLSRSLRIVWLFRIYEAKRSERESESDAKPNSLEVGYGCFLLFDTNSITNMRSKINPTTASPIPR